MVDFINQYRDVHGVEPICKELPIALPTDHLAPEIQRVWEENHRNYGEHKQLDLVNREFSALHPNQL